MTLGDMFKPKDGEWRCSTCSTMNKASATEKCAACEGPKPGAKPQSQVHLRDYLLTAHAPMFSHLIDQLLAGHCCVVAELATVSSED